MARKIVTVGVQQMRDADAQSVENSLQMAVKQGELFAQGFEEMVARQMAQRQKRKPSKREPTKKATP
jgi:hypothetical protein